MDISQFYKLCLGKQFGFFVNYPQWTGKQERADGLLSTETMDFTGDRPSGGDKTGAGTPINSCRLPFLGG